MVTNDGAAAATDVAVLSPVPGYTSLTTNSVTLNGTNVASLAPAVRIAIPLLAAGNGAVLRYDLTVGTPPVGVDYVTNRATATWHELTRTEVADNDSSGSDPTSDDGTDDSEDVGTDTGDDDPTVLPVTVPVTSFAITSSTCLPTGHEIRWESQDAILYRIEASSNLTSFVPVATGIVPTPPENVWTNAAPCGQAFIRVVGYR